jgi:Uma2 family endonuclease
MKEAKKQPMSVDDLDLNKRYTYADYLSWTFDETVELIRGKIFRMSPAPGRGHQKISMNLSRLVSNYLLGKKCEVFAYRLEDGKYVGFQKPFTTGDVVDSVVFPDLNLNVEEIFE